MSQNAFSPGSRYHGLPLRTRRADDGREIVYVSRRFVPPPEDLSLLRLHEVVEGDRLDHLAARYLGDPELFWRLADANRAMRPAELAAELGRRLRVTLPEGVQGPAEEL